jgi:hypothetical protein
MVPAQREEYTSLPEITSEFASRIQISLFHLMHRRSLNIGHITISRRDGPVFAKSKTKLNCQGGGAMDAKYDIFKKLPDGQPSWMKAVKGLDEAKSELTRIAEISPGEYFIFDTRNGAVISAQRNTIVHPNPLSNIDTAS